MDIRDYAYFLAIVDNGSITKAASALYISQPSLSIFLKKLEDRMGFQLFSRIGTKLVLTNEGKVYEEYARRISMISTELEQYFSDLETLNAGSLRIGLTANRGSLMLRLLPMIHQKLPNIKIELIEATSEQLEEQITAHKIDFAMLSRPFRNYELEFIPLMDEEALVAIPKCFDVSDKVKVVPKSTYPWIDIAQLRDYPFVLNKYGQRLRQISDYLFIVSNITPTIYMETGSIYNVCTAVTEQVGIGFLLDSYLDTYKLSREKATICSVGTGSVTKLQYVIAYPSDGYLSAPARKCVEIISDATQGALWSEIANME